MPNFSYARNFNGVADVFLRSPKLYKPLLDFIENVMLGASTLSKQEREIIAAHVSHINGCHFCVAAHRATLLAMGANEMTAATLEMGPNIKGISDQIKNLLMFAEKLTRIPAQITIADIDALKEQGISEQTIEDTVNVVSLFNYVNRLVDSFGVVGSPNYFSVVGTSLARNGYSALIPQAA